MIESALFFALGFLCAGFLTLMIAPAVWRRAVHLTRRRIEATLPLTLNEITAGTDKVRAEAAMATRRLEMRVSELRSQNAEQAVEVARHREDVKRMAAERDERSALVARLEVENAALQARLAEGEDALRHSARELAEANRTREAQAQEIRKLNGLYEETTYAASARQIELVARESEVEKLAGDSSRMKTRQRDIERRLEEADGERKAAVKALAEEKRRAAELERKVERLLATLADRDESIGRQQRELARGQGATAAAADEPEDGGAGSGRRARLETRLATLMRENKKLRSRLAEGSEPAPAAALREEIADLAAQVVNMTILLEGKDSAAARAIAQSGKPPAAGGTTSLADRVRALQQAAASR